MSGRHTGSIDAIDIAALGDEETERPASGKRIICYIAKSLQSARSITVFRLMSNEMRNRMKAAPGFKKTRHSVTHSSMKWSGYSVTNM